MGEREPLAQLSRRLLRGGAIERHRRRRAAGQTGELCTPFAGPDARNLYPVFPTVDDFFEAMHVHESRRVLKDVQDESGA
jgi:hypothetical protein